MRATWNGVTLAESGETVVVDGNHYFPASSLRMEYFERSKTTSVCGWKGKASYYSVRAGGSTNRDCAWCYEDPNEAAEKIRGMVAFWNGVTVE
ncbi:MAG: DUF427 domain-containing protein [Nitrosopumilus sp.]|nr:DUF427 domain-containing protein [Nitrosopumilus sp.]CAI9831184.1 conserved hypothetical protein [Nitrosopumilaceae archaeon]MDA7941607.1 DUF427 domain-containing protein [Nitrosopumilus sp.]MDA7943867.1 DUF427 domain-containing protein [Nitrosopumilus sp.]MDA7945245.1 DUF427 domain-containing protein [Nitrosopumilus sp.]